MFGIQSETSLVAKSFLVGQPKSGGVLDPKAAPEQHKHNKA